MFLGFRKTLFPIRALLPYREHFGIFGIKFCSLYGRRTVIIKLYNSKNMITLASDAPNRAHPFM